MNLGSQLIKISHTKMLFFSTWTTTAYTMGSYLIGTIRFFSLFLLFFFPSEIAIGSTAQAILYNSFKLTQIHGMAIEK